MKMISTRQALLIAASVFVLAAPGRAQSIQGVVVSMSTHRPLGRARVALVDDSGRVAAHDITDSLSGAFYLIAPKAGRYELKIVVGRGGLSFSPFYSLDSNQVVDHAFAAPDYSSTVLEAYLTDDVTTPATYQPGFRPPRYPDDMRRARRNGIVRARFVVDRDGRVDMSTFHIDASDDESFSRAALEFVDGLRLVPAERDGVPVSQVFEMGIDFGLANVPIRLRGKNDIAVRVAPPE